MLLTKRQPHVVLRGKLTRRAYLFNVAGEIFAEAVGKREGIDKACIYSRLRFLHVFKQPPQRQPCAASARAATAANPEIFILQQILSSIGPARGRLKT